MTAALCVPYDRITHSFETVAMKDDTIPVNESQREEMNGKTLMKARQRCWRPPLHFSSLCACSFLLTVFVCWNTCRFKLDFKWCLLTSHYQMHNWSDTLSRQNISLRKTNGTLRSDLLKTHLCRTSKHKKQRCVLPHTQRAFGRI